MKEKDDGGCDEVFVLRYKEEDEINHPFNSRIPSDANIFFCTE